MCAIAPVLAAVGAMVAGSLFGSDTPSPPQIESFSPEAQQLDITPPPTPTETPAFGQKSAEEMRKDADADAIRKNKRGVNQLRIDLDSPRVMGMAGAGQVGSGTVVPKG